MFINNAWVFHIKQITWFMLITSKVCKTCLEQCVYYMAWLLSGLLACTMSWHQMITWFILYEEKYIAFSTLWSVYHVNVYCTWSQIFQIYMSQGLEMDPTSWDIDFTTWDIKMTNLFIQFQMVVWVLICDVLLVLLKLLSISSFVFFLSHFILPRNVIIVLLLWGWLNYTRPFHTTCHARKH